MADQEEFLREIIEIQADIITHQANIIANLGRFMDLPFVVMPKLHTLAKRAREDMRKRLG